MSVPGMSPLDAAAVVDRVRVAQLAFEAFARARADIVVDQAGGDGRQDGHRHPETSCVRALAPRLSLPPQLRLRSRYFFSCILRSCSIQAVQS
jgi:hypothetical protein